MILNRKDIESILDPIYKKECIYLKETEIKLPSASGKFEIPHSHYVHVDSGHLNLIDFLIGYNELALLMLYHSPEIQTNFGAAAFNSFIVGVNKIKLKKPINAKQFEGKIKITRRIGNIFRTELDFEQESWTGQIDLALTS